MFSRLDPYFKMTFRHAENLDTRQGIRREEPHDEYKGKKHDHTEEKDNSGWEDSTSVSVSALRTFLAQLVKTSAQKTTDIAAAATAPPEGPSGPAAKAAQAYQATAIAVHADTENSGQPPQTPDDPDKPELSSEEIRIIHQLLNDLKELETAGVQTLTIERASSFLQSLANAVNKMRGRP